MIDGASNATTATIAAGLAPIAVAVNPVTNKIYVANQISNSVTVIDDATNTTTTVPAGSLPVAVAVNPVTNKIYVANEDSNNVTVIDGVTEATDTVTAGSFPIALAVNPVTNKIYVANLDNNVTVIDGLTNNTTTVNAGSGPISVAVNPVTNKIYVVNQNGNNVTVIDGATNVTSLVAAGTFPQLAVVNTATDKIYVANVNSANITVIDGATNSTTTVTFGGNQLPVDIAVNPVTNKIYVVIKVENGPNAVPTGQIAVLDGVTNIEVGAIPLAGYGPVALNPASNKIYVIDNSNVVMIDGATNAKATVPVSSNGSIAVNPVTNKVYVISNGDIAVITEANTQAATLSAVITPLPSSQSTDPIPGFTFTAASATVTKPDALYYQFDTLQDAWTAASGSNPIFTGAAATLQPGFHILYAYATDGQESASTEAGSALVGSIQAYGFLVVPAPPSTSVTVGTNPAGLSFTVDGTAYDTSHVFTWSVGDTHTIATTTPQISAAGTEYFFTSWSDAGTLSHNVTVSSAVTSYTASFSANSGAGPAGFVTSQAPGPLRNNYSGFVGMEFTVGATPTTVNSLGRFVVAGNTQSHLLKLVQANGTDVPGGSVSITTSGATPGTYQYAALANPVTLLANTSYFLVSQETAGGDMWYDYGSVSTASIATVVGPAYTNSNGIYVAVTTLPGSSYVPVSFLFAAPTTSLSVSITSPAANATISGAASITVATTGPVTSLQARVDGVNQGSPIAVSVNQGPAYTLTLDTTVLSVGAHSLTVVANGTVTSAPVSVAVNNAAGGSTPFVLVQTPGPVRNNFTGFVGMSFQIGSTSLVVTSLGRFALLGNAHSHVVKLVNANGTDVPNGLVSISMTGSIPGTFQYAALPAPLTLQPNTTYYLISQENEGGDEWYDYGAVLTSIVATVTGPAYTDGAGNYVTVGGLARESYVPVNFLYGSTGNTLSATITSPQSGALLSGSVAVSVSTTGTVASYQLQVDGLNKGTAVSASPITVDTTQLPNGQHTLSVVVSGNAATAASPAITVTVNNSGAATTAFVTSQSASVLRNNYTGYVGMDIAVGSTPLSVVSLGRYVVSGNSGSHILKLVRADGTDVPGGSVTLPLTGATAGQYAYAALPGTVTLAANTIYYLVSQETAGGDMWYDLEPVTNTAAAQVVGPAYTDGGGNYVTVGGFQGYSYVPVSFQYQ